VSVAVIDRMILPFLLFLLLSCASDEVTQPIQNSILRSEVLVSNSVFSVSYNEVYEQPNWVEYVVQDLPKNVDRGSMDFHKEVNIHTSDDADYYKNVWDKGHMAPAATFSDSYERLYTTFSFLNCALQYDDLNRGEWAQLEAKEREWSKSLGDINVRIELVFDSDHIVLPSGAHIPSAFIKQIEFPADSINCYYFLNQSPEIDWKESIINCN
jgi:endonuclease G, mitochondrial